MAKRIVKLICYKIVELLLRLEYNLHFKGVAYAIIKCKISRNYKNYMKTPMNWKSPKDLNEKINWLKLNTDLKAWAVLADKYTVREYVKHKGLEQILIPLYGKWETADEIDFDSLPSSFVLKTNHGSGDVVVVKNKDDIDRNDIIKKLNDFLNMPYGVVSGEPHYLFIKPCVIAEKYIQQTDFNSTSLIDYKIWCFNGEPYIVWVCYNRTKTVVKVNSYDLKWVCHPEFSCFTNHFQDGGGIVPKPDNLNEMLDIARKLAEGFKQVRVDLYNIEGHIYFGEMTFTSDGGYMDYFTPEFLKKMGVLIEI